MLKLKIYKNKSLHSEIASYSTDTRVVNQWNSNYEKAEGSGFMNQAQKDRQ